MSHDEQDRYTALIEPMELYVWSGGDGISERCGAQRGRRSVLCWIGLLLIVLAGGLLATAGPALGAVPLAWATPVRADDQPPFAWPSAIVGVSCPSTGLCVGVDGEGDVLSSTDPTGGTAAWIRSNVTTGFAGVSCPSSELCVAVGGAHVATSTDPTGGAGAWTVTKVLPVSPEDGEGDRLTAVSCPSARLCVATDEAGNVWTSRDPTGGVAAWTKTSVDGSEAILRGVSCPTEKLCVAVDQGGGDVLTSTDPTGGAGAWIVTDLDKYTLSDVSCSSETLCVAVGEVGDVVTSTDPTGGAGAWSSTHVSEGGGLIEHVSCASWGLCVADGSEDEVITSMEPTKGEQAWSSAQLELNGSLRSASCPASDLCVLTDSGSSVITATEPTAGAGAWTITHVEVGSNSFWGVSCVSVELCVGVDSEGNVVASTDPTGGASAWAGTHVDDHELAGVSCPSVGLCVVVDKAGDVITSTDPAGGAGAWSVADVDGTIPLKGVSCASVELCVAIDDEGGVLSSTDPTGGAGAWSRAVVGEPHIGGVSCPSDGLCFVTDGGKLISSTDPTGGAGAWNATGADVGGSISCPSVGLCVTLGFESVSTSTDPTGGAGAWSEAHIERLNGLDEVSCGSESLCVATSLGGNGSNGNVIVSSDPTGGAGAWTESNVYGGTIVPPESYLSLFQEDVTGVSCVAEGMCVVVDVDGEAMVGTPPVMPEETSAPTVSGTPAVGEVLSCSSGSWTGNPQPTFTYQWLGDGEPIGSATAATYTVQSTDQGHGLACQVTAANVAGLASATSNTLQVPAAQQLGGGGLPGGGGSAGGGGSPGALSGTVSDALVLNRIESVARYGTVKITLTLPGPGTLQIVGSAAQLAGASRTKKKHRTTLVIAQLRLTVSKAGRIVVTLVPTASAKAVLARRGKLRATITVTYTLKGGEPRSIVRTIVFRLRRRH